MNYVIEIPFYNGVIDVETNTIDVKVANETNLNQLTAEFALSNGAVATIVANNQITGITANNFSADVVYKITAEDGTPRDWTIKVKKLPPLSEGMVAYYPFNGNANDESGNGYNATVVEALLTTDRFGDIDRAYAFDGLDDRISTNYSIPDNSSFTLSGWYASSAADFQAFLGDFDNVSAPYYGFICDTQGAGENIHILARVADGSITEMLVTEPSVNDGGAHLLSIVYDDPNTTWTLYWDGLPRGTMVHEYVYSDLETMAIGSYKGSGGGLVESWDGTVDDFRIYNRALSDTEIADLFVDEGSLSSETDITSFNFNEQTSIVIPDVVNHTINIPVATGADLTSLIATFNLSDGARAEVNGIAQISGTTPNNFTGTVTYTIIAEDGTTQPWAVTVTTGTLSNATEITSFSFPEQTGSATIGTGTIGIEVASGTNLNGLVATFTLSDGASATVGGTFQVSGTTSNDFTNAVTYVVTAQDGVTTQDWAVTVTVEAASTCADLSISLDTTNPRNFIKGVDASVTVKAKVTDTQAISGVAFIYIRGNDTEVQIVAATDEGDGIFSFTFGPNDFKSVGIGYGFLVENVSECTDDVVGFIDLEIPENTENITSKLGFGSLVTNYRIFAMPLEGLTVGTAFEELSGKTNKKDWRILQYNGTTTSDLSTGSTLQPGTGYWFLAKESTTLNVGGGTTVNAGPGTPFTINLKLGWNLIGNPYLASLDWGDVVQHNIDEGVVTSEVETQVYYYTATGYNTKTTLGTFEGAYVMSSGAVTNFEIPITAAATGRKTTSTGRLISNFENSENWRLNFKIANGDLNHGLGAIGMNRNAIEGKDEYDLWSPPRFIEYIEMDFDLENEDYPVTQNVVRSTSEYTWEFNVGSSYDTPTLLQWDNEMLSQVDGYFVLVNSETSEALDMKANGSMSIPGKLETSMKVIFSLHDESILDQVSLLGDAYPNPLKNEVNIPVYISGERDYYDIKVSLYNLFGQRVVELLNSEVGKGSFEITWDGNDQSGTALPDGLYLYKLEYDNRSIPFKKLMIKR
ncbi:MAG: T9SS type A sorting domain-containing protein [Bacteroidetes bacterium]|nr:T9SS type A sorting domain-containing protein [Bacteroidota bacterium]